MKEVIKSKIRQNTLSFYNAQTGQIQPDIWAELQKGIWQSYSIDNHLYNDALGETKRCEWKPIFTNIHPIYPGFEWNRTDNHLVEKLYKPQMIEADYKSFMQIAEQFFRKYDGKKIGVHLSGGLDSSLIICLLNKFHIPFIAVGLTSQRFEFRTERKIQNIVGEYAEEFELIDLDNYPFYNHLDNTPKHQIPDSNIKMNEANLVLAHTFAKFGVDVVFTGQGGDTLLTEKLSFGDEWKGYNIENEFKFSWEQDLIYGPLGIELVSFFSDFHIIDQITSLRKGMKEDPLKLWARHFFRDVLPYELSDFSYCADFFGISMSGLEQAKPTIKMLLEEAAEYFHHPLFSLNGIEQIMSTDIFSLEYKAYTDLCTKISIAVWLHALFRKDI